MAILHVFSLSLVLSCKVKSDDMISIKPNYYLTRGSATQALLLPEKY